MRDCQLREVAVSRPDGSTTTAYRCKVLTDALKWPHAVGAKMCDACPNDKAPFVETEALKRVIVYEMQARLSKRWDWHVAVPLEPLDSLCARAQNYMPAEAVGQALVQAVANHGMPEQTAADLAQATLPPGIL